MASVIYFSLLLLLGAIAAFFSGLLGVGGGIFYVPGLSTLYSLIDFAPDVAMHMALGTSTAVIVVNATVASLKHRKHQTVRWDIAGVMIPGIILGSLSGGIVAGYLPGGLLKVLFGIFLFNIGVRYALNKHKNLGAKKIDKGMIAGVSFLIGIVGAMMGLGGGVLMVPYLSRFKLQTREVIAIASACLLPQSLFATTGYMLTGWSEAGLPAYSTGYVYWPAVVPLALMSVLITPLGVRMVYRVSQEKVRRVFGILLVLLSVYMIGHAALGLFI